MSDPSDKVGNRMTVSDEWCDVNLLPYVLKQESPNT